MSPLTESLRKVAVVLASLDAETADALIDRMPEERARQVRQALLELDQLDPAEQEAVVAEFLRQGQAAKQADLAGVEVEAGLAQRLELAGPTYQAAPLPTAPPPPALAEVATPDREADGKDTAQDDPARDGELFAFLHQLDADELVLHLEHERPQTLAVVVAYLPSDRSAELVSRLPSETQAEVLRRVAELGELDPQMVREVEHGAASVWRSIRPRRARAPPWHKHRGLDPEIGRPRGTPSTAGKPGRARSRSSPPALRRRRRPSRAWRSTTWRTCRSWRWPRSSRSATPTC